MKYIVLPFLAALGAATCFALDPVTDLNSAEHGWRFTVGPSGGDYVVASVSEYEGAEAPVGDSPARKIVRLVRIRDGAYSEDVTVNTIGGVCIVSGFGQQFNLGNLQFVGEAGGAETDGSRFTAATRRFTFLAPDDDKSRTRSIEYSIKIVGADEARRLAGPSVPLPGDQVANWTMTLPSVPAMAKQAGAGQPATVPEPKPEGKENPKPEPEAAPR